MKKRVPNQASKDSTSGAVVEPRIRSGSDFYRGRNRERFVFVGEVIAAVAGACLRVQETMSEEQQALRAGLRRPPGDQGPRPRSAAPALRP